MTIWTSGDTIVIRYIARSDGSVAMAIPAIVICDDDLLATYMPTGTRFMDNWVVPEAERVTAVSYPGISLVHRGSKKENQLT